MTINKLFHIRGIKYKIAMLLINKVYVGTKHFEIKRKLLNGIGYTVGEGTQVVGPIECTGKLVIGRYCWIGKNFRVNGNGTVVIGNNCDIAPEVTFQTGGHEIGDQSRRAGTGLIHAQNIGDGTWIGGRSTIIGDTNIGSGCVVAGCACVVKDVAANCMVGGVPAKIIKRL